MSHGKQLIKLLREHFGERMITGIEIGTGGGIITQAILSLSNVARLWTIDPWEHREGAGFEAGRGPQSWHNDRLHTAIDKIIAGKGTGRIIVCIMDSDEAITVIPPYVSFVWIDGDHTEEQVRRDICSYRNFVCKGGLIGGHDFGESNAVARVVKELFEDSEIRLGADTTWWVFEK